MKIYINNGKMTRAVILLIGTFLLGMISVYATQARTPPPPSSVSTRDEKILELEALARKFILEADAHHVRFTSSMSTITLVDDLDDYMGGNLALAQPLAYCRPSTNQIVINDLHWDSMNDVAKEQVLFHELGHCMLQRAHREDVGADGRKESIMSSRKRWVKNETYLKHRKEYLDELFDPKHRGDLSK